MDHSFSLARHFARLLSLLIRSPEAVDQQKLELRALVVFAKEGGTVRLTTRRGQLNANGIAVPDALAGVRELSDRMAGHGIESIGIGQEMVPGEVLEVARIIAGPVEEDQDRVHQRLRALDARTVTVVLAAEEAPAPVAAPAPSEPAPGAPGRLEFVLAAAARGGDGRPLAPLFEEVAFAVEQATRQGRTADAVRAFHLIVTHEPDATHAESRRQFVLAVRRLTKPEVLDPIARCIEADPSLADAAISVLARCGTDGADAVVDEVVRAASGSERQAFVAALSRLPVADEALVSMLGDERPHVARVAAELISERKPMDGDKALATLLAGAEARVRRAAVRALRAYDTPFSGDAIARALEDSEAEVRLEAAAALAARRTSQALALLERAVEAEPDAEVQLSLVGALGRAGTPEAVTRLGRLAEAASGLFGGRRDASVRVAAVRALAVIGTPSAINALKPLAHDGIREVREAAARALRLA